MQKIMPNYVFSSKFHSNFNFYSTENIFVLGNRKRDQIYDHLEKAEKDAEKKQKERERQQGGGILKT